MRIKGHTIIELTDVKTGKVERYEDDNMVTNALSYFLQDAGMVWSSPLKYNEVRNDPLGTLLGGLLMFDDVLPENANNMTTPAGVKMTGNGAKNYTYDGQDGVTEFGSWNYTESGWTNDGKYRQVWDFSTSQANGTIASLCLTSRRNGYIGAGNATSGSKKSNSSYIIVDGKSANYNVDDMSTQVLNRIVGVHSANSVITFADYYSIYYDQNHASEFMGTTGKLKLLTKKIPLSKFDLRETFPYMNQPDTGKPSSQSYIPVTETEITLPVAFKNAVAGHSPWVCGKYGDYFYILASTLSGLAPNDSVQGVRIKCSDFTVVQSFTVTNTTQTAFSVYDSDVSFGNDQIAIYSNANRVVFQDLFNNPDTEELPLTASTGSGYDRVGGGYFREDSWIIDCYRIDMVSRTASKVNTAFDGRWGRFIGIDNPFFFDYSPKNGGYWGLETFDISYTADYIATINNLANPVVKSAEKTMKVTYVVSFDDGE